MRNLFLHSGGHWNSKAVKDSRKINKIFSSINSDENEKKKVPQKKVFITAKSAITPKIAYSTTLECFQQIIKDTKLQIENNVYLR